VPLDPDRDRTRRRRPRAYDRDVHRAKPRDRRFRARSSAGLGPRVPHEMTRLSPRVRDLSDALGDDALVLPGHQNPRPTRRQRERDRFPPRLVPLGDPCHETPELHLAGRYHDHLEHSRRWSASPGTTKSVPVSPKSEKAPAPKSEKAPSAAQRGRRIALAIFTLFTAAFIGLSTAQIGRQVFGYSNTYPEVSPSCAYALKWFEETLANNEGRALQEQTAERAEETLLNNVKMQMDTIEHKCAAPGDREALSAAARLRDAVVSQNYESYANLARLHRAVDMRIGR